MRAAWRLCISGLLARPSRSVLLLAVVALSALLISAVGVATGSVLASVRTRASELVGEADARIEPAGSGARLDEAWLDRARAMEGVERAEGVLAGSLSLRAIAARYEGRDAKIPEAKWTSEQGPFALRAWSQRATTRALGLDADSPARQQTLAEGRWPASPSEIVINQTLARRLGGVRGTTILDQVGGLSVSGLLGNSRGDGGEEPPRPAWHAALAPSLLDAEEARAANARASIRVGDVIQLVRPRGAPTDLRVVGIVKDAPLAASPWAGVLRGVLAEATGAQGRLSRIDLVLADDLDPEAFATRVQAQLPEHLIIQTTQRISSGLERDLKAQELGFAIGTLFAYLAASFIIATGMSTAIVERTRELAILRAVGASRRVLAISQLMQGAVLGIAGGLVGVPLGTLLAYFVLLRFEERLAAPPTILPTRVLWAVVAACLAGMVGALLPAVSAARVSPLQGLASRARVARTRGLVLCLIIGLASLLVHVLAITLPRDGTVAFYVYLILGVPAILAGYFLLGVPVAIGLSRALSPLLSRLLGLPRDLLARSIRATPYRVGFTCGAMMLGMSLLVSLWTQGGAALRDWLASMRFPDAFAVGINLPQQAKDDVLALPEVERVSAVTLQPVETTAFGVRGLARIQTFFVAFDVDEFLSMTSLEWIEGDEATATRRLKEGGGVLVSKEFLIARKAALGETFVCTDPIGREHRFEILGVVASPGLEVANNLFDIGQDFSAQRVHAVFGSRQDLIDRFGNESIGMLQLDLAEGVDDVAAMEAVREALAPYAVLNAESGRGVMRTLTGFVETALTIATLIAVFALVVASFAVANLVIAGVHARSYEFGVLLAVGGTPSLAPRLVIAEAILVGVAAALLGTLLGLQGAWGGNQLNAALWGIALPLRPPWVAIAAGSLGVVVLCALAAAQPAWSLMRRSPRALLAGRG